MFGATSGRAMVVGTCVLGGLACSAVAAAQEMPPWLEAALAREGSALETQVAELQNGSVNAVLTGKLLSEPEDFEGGTYVQTDIGGEGPLECIAYHFAADPAATVANLANEAITVAEAEYGAVTNRVLTAVRSAAYDGVPYHYLEWTYTVGAAPDARLNMAKVAVAHLGDVTLACSHNEVGYRATFAQAFERFVRSAEKRHAAPQPYYEEIVLFAFGEQTLGYNRVSLTLDADGDTVVTTLTSMLSPADAQNLKTSDGWKTAYSTPDGLIINQTETEASGGELVYALELEPAGAADWAVSGEFRGKPFSATLQVAEPPRSDLGQLRLLRELINDKERMALQFPLYSPGASPGEFMLADVQLDPERRATGAARLTIGPIVMDVQIDATGSIPQGTMDMGLGQMRIERIWRAGEID